MSRVKMTDENDDFLILTDEELKLIGDLRSITIATYGGEVLGDVTEITPEEITLKLTRVETDKDDIVIINRQFLSWEV